MIQIPKIKPIRLRGKAKTEFKREVANAARELCQGCDGYVPLLMFDGRFDAYYCGHVHHLKTIGAGGDDTIDNCVYLCNNCHHKIHTGEINVGDLRILQNKV